MILRAYAGLDPTSVFCLLQSLVNRVFGNPNLAVGTTTTRIQVTNQVDFAIANQVYRKAAEDNISVTGLTNTTATQFRKARVEINTAGTVSFKEGPAATAQVNAIMPRRTASRATLGWLQVPNSFTYGTTAFTAGMFFNGDPDLSDLGSALPNNDRGIEQAVVNSP